MWHGGKGSFLRGIKAPLFISHGIAVKNNGLKHWCFWLAECGFKSRRDLSLRPFSWVVKQLVPVLCIARLKKTSKACWNFVWFSFVAWLLCLVKSVLSQYGSLGQCFYLVSLTLNIWEYFYSPWKGCQVIVIYSPTLAGTHFNSLVERSNYDMVPCSRTQV